MTNGRSSSTEPADPGAARDDESALAVAVLEEAVREIAGSRRPGQVQMAEAVSRALDDGTHLLVQAGTGTGKSLGYLAPALIRLVRHPRERIIVATATLALQHQLAEHDVPAALDAVEQVTGRRPKAAVLKGRTNYACRLRVGDAPEEQGALIESADLIALELPGPSEPERAGRPAGASGTATTRTSATTGRPGTTATTPTGGTALAVEVLALREWADDQHRAGGLADRDDAPPHTERAWQHVSIPVRECLGVQRCPYGDSCFVERSREVARAADLVVTNHALLAIDAMHGGTALPEHTGVIIDEAHELVARVTAAASAELSPGLVERVARRALTWLEDDVGLDLLDAADALRAGLAESPLARIEDPDSPLIRGCVAVRTATRAAVSAMAGEANPGPDQRQAAAAVKEVFDIAERMAALRPADVVWISESERLGREARVAPLSVAALMRKRVFGEQPTVLTSATLKLGGTFDRVATSTGLRIDEQVDEGAPGSATDPDLTAADPEEEPTEGDEPAERWRGLDVGTPFDYARQGILYVARSLPPPGRDGLADAALAEIAELVWAAGGRTLGLFSSRRAAEAAAARVRRELPKLTILCQGDAQLPELTRRFLADETVSLFGTLSLWQGLDVPGATCSLVIIDRIPFPRPDEPLTTARQRAVAEAGGNGFMEVAATHAALLLAQGAGRLIRRSSDRGMVAVLDPRLVTARYGPYLRASMPGFWPTTDREIAIQALRRLSGAAGASASRS